jgi:hypothetical protein
MIIEHRTYTVAQGRMEEYLALYERAALPLQLKYLGHLVGFFTSEIGPLNQVVHLWRYDSLADRETRRARMNADPEWRAYVKSIAGMFVSQESKILNPTQFSPLQ